MLIFIDRSRPLSTRSELYLDTDPASYGHFSALKFEASTEHAAELALTHEIDTKNLRLMTFRQDDGYLDYLPLDLRTGLAICELPLEQQALFWEDISEDLDLFCKKFTYPEVVRSQCVICLRGTLSHLKDEGDSFVPFLVRKESGETVVDFASIHNFGGPCGPDLMLDR
jgi:hypothetical protein